MRLSSYRTSLDLLPVSVTHQCLLGIILMQAGQEYAKRQEEAEMRKLDARTARAGATAEGVVVGGDVQGKKDL